MKLNFAWLARVSTGRQTWFKGLLPPLSTLVSLLAVSAVIATGFWAWSFFTAGALAQAASFLPLWSQATLGVVGFSLANFWFNRDIKTFALSTREVRSKYVYSKHENPTDVRKMVKHLREELNVHFGDKFGDKHQNLPRVRLCTFSDPHFHMTTVEGRNPGNAAIFLSSGVFGYHDTGMNQRHLAALLQLELAKIYMRRGVARTIVGIGNDLLSNLQLLSQGDWFSKSVWTLTIPLQLPLLVARSISRSYEYEAMKVVIDCGRGPDLIDALNRKVCSTLDEMPTDVELKQTHNKHRRQPYNGFLSSVLRPITDWIDENEYEGDAKDGYRIVSLFDILVRELGYFVQELWSEKPRTTRLKDEARLLIKAEDPTITLGNIRTEQRPLLDEHARNINQTLQQRMLDKHIYAPIACDGSGYVAPKASHHHHHHADTAANDPVTPAQARSRRQVRFAPDVEIVERTVRKRKTPKK